MLKKIEIEMSKSFSANDIFFVDTNVLLWVHEPESSAANRGRASVYSNFIMKLKRDSCKVCVSVLNLQEAFHRIEKIHLDLYRTSNGDIKPKHFRRNAAEREKLARAQQSFWQETSSFYNLVSESISESDMHSFVTQYNTHLYEPMDYLIATHHPSVNVITGDYDFSSDPTITMYTY